MMASVPDPRLIHYHTVPVPVSVLVILQGSRGDVLPFLLLLQRISSEHVPPTATTWHIVTHCEHRPLCEQLLCRTKEPSPSPRPHHGVAEEVAVAPKHTIECVFLQTVSVSLTATSDGAGGGLFRDDVELAAAVAKVLRSSSTSKSSSSVVCVWGNLFALQASLVAERLRVPCGLLHPAVPPVCAETHQQILRCAAAAAAAGDGGDGGRESGRVVERSSSETARSVSVARRWLWPTLTSAFDDFRDALDVSLAETGDEVEINVARRPVPPTVVLLAVAAVWQRAITIETRSIPAKDSQDSNNNNNHNNNAVDDWEEGVEEEEEGTIWTGSIQPVLPTTCSPSLAGLHHWISLPPSPLRTTIATKSTVTNTSILGIQQPIPSTATTVDCWEQSGGQRQRPVVCVDFGSTTGVLQSLHGNLVADALRLLSLRGCCRLLLLTHHRHPQQQQSESGSSYDCLVHAHDLPPDQMALLLRKCNAVIHHGGIGTAQSALFAGVPQGEYPLLSTLY
jgi:hypothetical protein